MFQSIVQSPFNFGNIIKPLENAAKIRPYSFQSIMWFVASWKYCYSILVKPCPCGQDATVEPIGLVWALLSPTQSS